MSARDWSQPAPPVGSAVLDPTARRRRGRPYRLPEDPTPITAATPCLKHRIAWLLGTSRIHSTDPELARRDRFIAELKARGIVLDSTRLSRWESGQLAVPRTVITAYEQILNLASDQLSLGATAFVPSREITPSGRRHDDGELGSEVLHERLDDLFVRILRGRAPGNLWIELAELITRSPNIYLMPATWSQVAELLADELGHSTGLAYLSRFKAQRLLVAHSGSRRAAVRAIGGVVTNPVTEFVTHPLALLQEVDEPQANDLLLRVLNGIPSNRRRGASWAIAGKLQAEQLDDTEITRIEEAAVRILNGSRSPLHRMDALNIYLFLPAPSRQRLMKAVHDADIRAVLETTCDRAETATPETARSVSTKMAKHVQEHTHTPFVVEPDPMLQRLVRESLFHVSHARRAQASLLLAASPYRGQLGAPLLELAENGDEVTAVAALTTMTYVADAGHRTSLFDHSLTDPRPAVRVAALMALGQVVGTLDVDEIEHLRRAMPAAGPLHGATTHVLGIGAAPLLMEIAADGDPLALAARWWGRSGAISEPMVRS